MSMDLLSERTSLQQRFLQIAVLISHIIVNELIHLSLPWEICTPKESLKDQIPAVQNFTTVMLKTNTTNSQAYRWKIEKEDSSWMALHSKK